MADRSKIEWCDASWTPVRARHRETKKVGWHCEHASPGCLRCYAEAFNLVRGTGLPFKPGHLKDVEVFLDEKMLEVPFRWREPRKIFVCSMTDLFGEFVPEAMIVEVYGVMAVAGAHGPFHGPGDGHTPCGTWTDGGGTTHQMRLPNRRRGPHTFQVLTKRSSRMRKLLNDPSFRSAVAAAAYRHAEDRVTAGAIADAIENGSLWPLPNVWAGVSFERQREADERLPDLRETPAAVRFASAEPLLERVEVTSHLMATDACANCGDGSWFEGGRGCCDEPVPVTFPGVDVVIIGGESGYGARDFDQDAAHHLIEQCRAAGTMAFLKQVGARPMTTLGDGFMTRWRPTHPKGGDPDEWSPRLRVRELPPSADELYRRSLAEPPASP
jgi:protein gp37